jgi:hypothetical protein
MVFFIAELQSIRPHAVPALSIPKPGVSGDASIRSNAPLVNAHRLFCHEKQESPFSAD